MAIPTPYTWVDGTVPPAALLNAGHKDVLNFLLDPPRCRGYRATAGTPLPAGADTAVNLDGEDYDSTGGMHSLVSNLARIVAPEDGLYQVYAQIGVVQNVASSITCNIRRNGANVASSRVPTINSVSVSTVAGTFTEVEMSAGDYVEMFANLAATASPSTGSNITYMTARWAALL